MANKNKSKQRNQQSQQLNPSRQQSQQMGQSRQPASDSPRTRNQQHKSKGRGQQR